MATLRTSRVINVVGPRQAGKTTLVRDMVEAAQFLNLDDETLLASLALDSYGQLSTLAAEAGETEPADRYRRGCSVCRGSPWL